MTDTWVDILVDEAHEKTRGMNDCSLHRALVQAGYRAGLEEAIWIVKQDMTGYADDDAALTIAVMKLDAKLKEQP